MTGDDHLPANEVDEIRSAVKILSARLSAFRSHLGLSPSDRITLAVLQSLSSGFVIVAGLLIGAVSLGIVSTATAISSLEQATTFITTLLFALVGIATVIESCVSTVISIKQAREAEDSLGGVVRHLLSPSYRYDLSSISQDDSSDSVE